MLCHSTSTYSWKNKAKWYRSTITSTTTTSPSSTTSRTNTGVICNKCWKAQYWDEHKEHMRPLSKEQREAKNARIRERRRRDPNFRARLNERQRLYRSNKR